MSGTPAEDHAVPGSPAPMNAAGLRRLCFNVDDLDVTVQVALDHGGELMGELVTYEDVYRLGYLRGPEGIILMLAQDLRG